MSKHQEHQESMEFELEFDSKSIKRFTIRAVGRPVALSAIGALMVLGVCLWHPFCAASGLAG